MSVPDEAACGPPVPPPTPSPTVSPTPSPTLTPQVAIETETIITSPEVLPEIQEEICSEVDKVLKMEVPADRSWSSSCLQIFIENATEKCNAFGVPSILGHGGPTIGKVVGCCNEQCGICGGKGCAARPGGKYRCCLKDFDSCEDDPMTADNGCWLWNEKKMKKNNRRRSQVRAGDDAKSFISIQVSVQTHEDDDDYWRRRLSGGDLDVAALVTDAITKSATKVAAAKGVKLDVQPIKTQVTTSKRTPPPTSKPCPQFIEHVAKKIKTKKGISKKLKKASSVEDAACQCETACAGEKDVQAWFVAYSKKSKCTCITAKTSVKSKGRGRNLAAGGMTKDLHDNLSKLLGVKRG